MKVIDPGHRYLLNVLDDLPGAVAELVFVKREGDGYPWNVGHHSGTQMQEVLRALVERIEYLGLQGAELRANGDTTGDENDEAVREHLISAIYLLEERAAHRHGRPVPTRGEAVAGPTCGKCGHVGCAGECHPIAVPS